MRLVMESAHYRDVEVKYVHSGLMAQNSYLLTMTMLLIKLQM